MYKIKYILMQTQYFNFLHIEISYRMMHGINDDRKHIYYNIIPPL